MKKKPKGIKCTELFALIPAGLIQNLEQETKVNHQVKKLSGDLMLKILLFSLLNSERTSLRVIEELCLLPQFRSLTGKERLKIKRSSLSDRIAGIDYVFFQRIFESLYEKFFPLLAKNSRLNIFRFDSTLVGLSAKLLDFGMRIDRENHFVKFTVGLKNSLPSDVKFFKEQSEISEEVALKETILSSKHTEKSIVVFDRGLQNRKAFAGFTARKISFVTRLKGRLNYQEIRVYQDVKNQKTETLQLEKDIIVRLKDEHGRWTKEEFRLIGGRSISDNSEINFLTNITKLDAKTVTDIYRQRWGIEVFFKFLKQELNFKHLLNRTENGIKVMLYVTLILALMLIVYKELNKISGYKIAKLRFAIELETELLKEIIIRCGGDITKFFGDKNPYPK